MPGEVGRVAVAVREDLRVRVVAADERVVGRNAAVVADAQDLADVAVQTLRGDPHARVVGRVVPVVIVQRQVDHAVRTECGAACHRPALHPAVRFEDLLNLDQRRAVEPRACECEGGHRLGAILDVVQIHEAVRSELRMHDDRLQRRGVEARCGPTCKRLGHERAAAHQAHAAGLRRDCCLRRDWRGGVRRRARAAHQLGDQEVAVRCERDVARAREPLGYGDEAHAEQLAGRALALRLAVRRARARHPGVEHERAARAPRAAVRLRLRRALRSACSLARALATAATAIGTHERSCMCRLPHVPVAVLANDREPLAPPVGGTQPATPRACGLAQNLRSFRGGVNALGAAHDPRLQPPMS